MGKDSNYEKPVLCKQGNVKDITFEDPTYGSSVGDAMAIIGNLR